jgi:hypothetical protein
MSETTGVSGPSDQREPSAAELVKQLSEQTSRLVRQEVELAKAELTVLTGKSKVQQAMPPVPQDSVDSVKEDVQWTKARAQQGRE